MTWQRFMSRALETKVAKALPGIALDGSYAKYAAKNQTGEEIELPLSSSQPELLRTTQGSNNDTSSSEVVIVRPPQRSDAVVQVLQDMFSAFKTKPQRKRRVRNSNRPVLFKPNRRSSSRSRANARRLRQLMDSR
jgi:hypothetical protein